MTFPEKIRKILFIKNMNQADLARLMETSETTVSRWIKGIKPRNKALNKLADILNVQLETLVNDDLTEDGTPDYNKFEEEQRKAIIHKEKVKTNLDYDSFDMNEFHKENIHEMLNLIERLKESNVSDEKILSQCVDESLLGIYRNVFLYTSQLDNILESVEKKKDCEKLYTEVFEVYSCFVTFAEELKISLEPLAKCAKKAKLEDFSKSLEKMASLDSRKRWKDMDI